MNMNPINIKVPKFSHEKVKETKFSPFFQVLDVPSLRGDTKEDTGDRYLVNENTNKIVGRVTSRYRLVTHKAASDIVKQLITKTELEYQSLGAQTSNGGSRFFETLIFPSLCFNPATGAHSTALDTTNPQKDDMFPAITIRNSYDKTSPVIFGYGMYRLVCSNGMSLPIRETKLSFKHTQTIDFERVRSTLLLNLEDSTKLMDIIFKRLNGENGTEYLCKILSEHFTDRFKIALFDRINQEHNSIHVDYDSEHDPDNPQRIIGLKIRNIKADVSAYAIYNVVTEIATHKLTNRSEREVANTKIAKVFISGNSDQ